MDSDFKEFKKETENLRNKAENILNNYKRQDFESNKCYKNIERFVEHLDDCIKILEYYDKPAQEGKLIENNRGRFDLMPMDYNLSSGSSLELLIDDEWCVGRVEYSHGKQEGYYFYNYDGDTIMLKTGMIARVRR